MKYIVLFLSVFLLFSCWSSPEVISMENDKNIENSITLQTELYDNIKPITFSDQNDLNNFEKRLVELDKEIESNTWSITSNQVVEKARLLDYTWKTWEALKLYEENFDKDNNDKSLAYNNNMAKLYEKLWAYEQAIGRYSFLIEYFNRADYLRNIANIWKKLWDEEKYKKFMDEYNKIFNAEPEVKEIEVSSWGTVELSQ